MSINFHFRLQFCITSSSLIRANSAAHLNYLDYFFSPGSTDLVGQDLLLVGVSRSHSDTPHSIQLLWKSDRTLAETSTWQHNVYNRDIVLQAGFEPAIPASEGPQTHTLGRAATRIGAWWYYPTNICGLEQIVKFLVITFPTPLCYFPLAWVIPFSTLLKHNSPVFTLLTCHRPTTSPTCA